MNGDIFKTDLEYKQLNFGYNAKMEGYTEYCGYTKVLGNIKTRVGKLKQKM